MDTVVRTEIQHVWPGVRETSYLIHLSGVDYMAIIIWNHADLELWVEVTIYLLM